MKKFCLALDLIDDDELLAEYEYHHQRVWPEVIKSITDAGITNMEIYRYGTRLFMTMETDDNFTFERKGAMDASNSKVQEWEEMMWKYQKPVPGAKPGEKWVFMNKIFQLI